MAGQRLVQITDLHLREEPGDILCSDVVTDHSLGRVLDDILEREGAGLQILATGDLVQDPVISAYRRLRAILEGYPFRFACLLRSASLLRVLRKPSTRPVTSNISRAASYLLVECGKSNKKKAALCPPKTTLVLTFVLQFPVISDYKDIIMPRSRLRSNR